MKYTAFIKGNMLEWTGQTVNNHLKYEATPLRGKVQIGFHKQVYTLDKEVYRLEYIVVINRLIIMGWSMLKYY